MQSTLYPHMISMAGLPAAHTSAAWPPTDALLFPRILSQVSSGVSKALLVKEVRIENNLEENI